MTTPLKASDCGYLLGLAEKEQARELIVEKLKTIEWMCDVDSAWHMSEENSARTKTEHYATLLEQRLLDIRKDIRSVKGLLSACGFRAYDGRDGFGIFHKTHGCVPDFPTPDRKEWDERFGRLFKE